MESQQDLRSCLVIWRGRKLVVEISASAVLKDLGEELQKLTSVNTDTLRLLVPLDKSSRLLYPFSEEHSCLRLKETSILKVKSIRMMGLLKDEVDEVMQNEKVDHRIAGFEEEGERLRQRNIDGSHASRKLPSGTYIFCDFRTLSLPGVEGFMHEDIVHIKLLQRPIAISFKGQENYEGIQLSNQSICFLLFPPASKAMELLHMLASDPGIIAIMNKHRWRVGILTEMAPIGYVGVTPKCILGFNKNCGEEISLRLRTDDLKGFRKYQSIKKTLLHELAHMVYSEHDANFYTLDKQLNAEATTLDWTKSRGHTLSEVAHSQNYEVEFEYSNETASKKVGGQAPILPNARASSVDAAFQRFISTPTKHIRSSEEPKKEPDPDGQTDNLVEIESHLSEMETIEEPNFSNSGKSNDEVGSKITVLQHKFDGCGAEQNLGTNGSSDTENMDSSRQANTEVPFCLTSGQREPDSSGSRIEVMQLRPEVDDPELQIIQDSVTVICTRLQNAIKKLKSEVSTPQSTVVLQTLTQIIRNIAEHPEDLKFKKLRKANPTIQRNIIRHKAAMEILELIGFYEDIIVNEFGNAESFLVFKRNDPGLLWLAKSSLENSIADETAQ